MIALRGIRKRYGRVTALAGVDLELLPGRVTGVVGPNGAGKTTLLKVMLGLVRPDAGELWFAGERTEPDAAFRARIGYMPQRAAFPRNLTGQEVLALLLALRRLPTLPDSRLLAGLRLEPDLARPVGTLSDGTRQKLSAAIAFAFAPELLVLDEPTAGLDPPAATVLKDRIREERARGRTILVSSHVMAELEEICDEIAFLDEGALRFSGPLEELRAGTGQRTLERAVAALMEPAP